MASIGDKLARIRKKYGAQIGGALSGYLAGQSPQQLLEGALGRSPASPAPTQSFVYPPDDMAVSTPPAGLPPMVLWIGGAAVLLLLLRK